MALLWIEGFESIGTTNGNVPAPTGVLARKYTMVSESSMKVQAGRISGHSLNTINWNNNLTTKNFPTTNATLICGFAFYSSGYATSPNPIVSFYDNGTLGVNVRWLTGGELGVYRGSTQLGVTSGLGLLLSTWYYIELKVLTANGTSGAYDLHLNGSSINANGACNTKAGADNYHNAVAFPQSGSIGNINATIQYDDIYICDGSGSANNNFLGNMKVLSILPNGDTGTQQFTPSTNGSHYTLINEEPIADDSNYVEDTVSGHQDIYDYGSVTGTGATIAGIQINTCAKITDANSFSLKTPILSGSANSDDSGQSVTSNYTTLIRISETDPNTNSAWTANGINAAQFGVEVA